MDVARVTAPTGGSQTGERLIFGMPYSKDGVIDTTVEYFAGVHDSFSSWNYKNDDVAKITFLKNDNIFIDISSGALLIPSIPLAAVKRSAIFSMYDFVKSLNDGHSFKKYMPIFTLRLTLDEVSNEIQFSPYRILKS